MNENDINKTQNIEDLPSAFCSVFDIPRLETKLKNQGKSNLCWDYAFMGCAEIVIQDKYNSLNTSLGKNNLNFSEKKLAYYYRKPESDKLKNYSITEYIDERIYNDFYEQNIAGEHELIRTLFDGNELVDEGKDKSLESVINGEGFFENREKPCWINSEINLKEATIYDFSKCNFDEAKNEIKKLIYKKKALWLRFLISNSKNETEIKKTIYKRKKDKIEIRVGTIYRNYCSGLDMDHCVTLVGWDDNFPKENFIKQRHPNGKIDYPEGNGAWVIKNSYDNDCYYYVSYYHDIKELNGKKKFNCFKIVDFDFVLKHDSYDNSYRYGLNLKRKDTFKQFLLINNNEGISLSYKIYKKKEKLVAISLESEYNGKINVEICVNNNKLIEKDFSIKEGLNYLPLDDKSFFKDQIVKIIIKNIDKKILMFYLQEEEVKFNVSEEINVFSKILDKYNNGYKNIHLFKLNSLGENFCTYIHDGKEETFTKYYNNGKKYVIMDIALLTKDIKE